MFDDRSIPSLVGLAAVASLTLSMAGCSQSVDRDASDDEPPLQPEQTTETDRVNEAPVADFDIGADLPESGDPVTFDASASTDPNGDDLTYAWRFGDETPGGGEMISHIYTDGGDFEVTLTVADEDGATDSATETLSIKDTPFGEGDAEVTIIVRDLDFDDLAGVEVSPVGSDRTKTTGDDGRATFENMPTGDPLVFDATKDGYAKQVARMRLPESTTSAPVMIRMQPIGAVVEVDAIEKGAEVDGYDGARLEFPPEAVVDADGNPVTGTIQVEFTTFDVSDSPEIDGFPGAFLGLRPDGNIDPILSFGAMEVNLKQNDKDLQIKPGETVEMDIPAYAAGVPMEADIPVWSLDESTGIWVDEGEMRPVESEASPTGRALRTKVTHFTTWNGDYPMTTPCKMKPKCQIVDPDTGRADVPLKTGQTCEVKVTSGTLPGLGNRCRTPEANVSGQQCSNNSDCKACRAQGTDIHGDLCSSDSDCKVCENAKSPIDSANGEACSSDFDCNYQAEDGKECTNDGSSCSADSECFDRECTNADSSTNGTSCSQDSDCTYQDKDGKECSHDGSSCSSDSDCSYKVCEDNTGLSCSSDSNCPTIEGACAKDGALTGNTCTSDSDCSKLGASCYGESKGNCVTKTASCNQTYTTKTGNCSKDQDPDCEMTYRTDYGDCNTQTCDVPSGISCNTSNLPGGQSIPGGGVCKDNSQCQGVQFCSSVASSGSASGQCALPGSGGVFAGATGRFNETFMVDPKGNYVSGEGNPEADQGWLWVPNVDLQLRGTARDGSLHGATNVSGHDSANKAFKDGTARKCNHARPTIPMRHSCGNGVSGLKGNCPKLRRKHFCEMVFKCPLSDYSRSFTKKLGTPNVQECIEKFENDFDIPLLQESIESDRARFNGNESAYCLDQIAALRHAVNRADDSDERRQICAKFDKVALEQTACTGVQGKIGKDKSCAHDLECKDLSDKVTRGCKREAGSTCLGTCQDDVAAERRCGDSHVCEYGQYCDQGTCYDKHTRIGARCDAANQCSAGLYCNLGAAKCKRLDFVAKPGAACSRQASCALGLQCMPDGNGTLSCSEFSRTGGSCIGQAGGGTSGCMWDTFCDDQNCVAKKSHGANCEADHECMSGVCKRQSPQALGTCFGPQKPMSCQ